MKTKLSMFRRIKDWGIKIWLVISLLMGIATLTIGSHGVSKMNADQNTKMLDRTKYLVTFIYEILTASLKIIDPLLGLACLFTKKKIYLKLFFGLKTILISSQLVGTTYLFTIRLNFEQLTNTRYEACYYKIGNDTECTEAWQSLTSTYKDCGNALNTKELILNSRYSYSFQEQEKQQQSHLWHLIESLPVLVKETDEIIQNTTINDTTTNIFSWWDNVANKTQTIYDEYRKNTSVITLSELDQLIRLIPEHLQNISSIINSTTITVEGTTTTTTINTGQSTMVTSSIVNYITAILNTTSTSSPTTANLIHSSDATANTPEILTTEPKTFSDSALPNTSDPPLSEETDPNMVNTVFPIAIRAIVRQQAPTQFTTNVRQWWNPFKQFLINIEKEYQKMIAIRPLPSSSPPPECQQDLYHMKYIATDLTVSVIIYSLNMITDVAAFFSILELSKALMEFNDKKRFQRF